MEKAFQLGANVFVIRDGKLLMGKRKGYGAGQWGLPGGHIERGEAFADAAVRELAEETGISVRSVSFLNLVNQPRREEGHYVQIGFLAIEPKGEPQNLEPDRCEGWQWFPLDSLPEPLFVAHRELIVLYKKGETFLDDLAARS